MSTDQTPSRLLRDLRRRTQAAVRAEGPPTQLIAIRRRDADVSDPIAQDVLDLALRLGEALLSVGASVSDVTATVLRVAAAYGLTSCQVDITFTSITVSAVREDGEPRTVMRIVKVRGIDYTRMDRLYELAAKAAAGIPLETALERLEGVVRAHHPYRRWVVTAALAGMAAAVTGLLGGGIVVAALAGLSTAAIDRVMRRLNRWGLPAFFQQVTGAGIVTLVAVAILLLLPHIPFDLDSIAPGLVVAAGITVLLAGLSLVGATQDAITGHYLTAGARVFEVMMLTVGIVTGIGAVLDVAHRYGLDLAVSTVGRAQVPILAQILLAAAVAACWGLSSYARPRGVAVAAVVGGISHAVYTLARDVGVGPAVASGVAALVIGAIAALAGSRFGIATIIVATCGIVPLLPGLAVYRAMFTLVQESAVQGVTRLLGAVTIGLALAAGVALGSFLAGALSPGEDDRWERRVKRRARAPRD